MSNPPTAEMFAGEQLKLSAFYPRAKVLNVRNAWASWNGYKFANYYYEPEYEYFCIRNQCATYDICAMQKYSIRGPDAETMLNRMVTRDITKFGSDRVGYTVWCTDAGRLIDDGTIFKFADDNYMLTCGAPMTAWLAKSAFGFDVEVKDITDELAGLSLQGPTSCAVLKKMGLAGIETAKPFDIRYFDFHGDRLMVSRTGFTGDLGYELWIDPALGVELWDDLYAAGADYGIQPFGEEATNMARLEAAFIMPGMEFNEALQTVHFEHDQTPFELDLGWLVDFKKPHFSGRQALLEEHRRGPKYTLTKLDIEGNRPAEDAHIYANKRCTKEVGYVTSAMWSPAVKANIALAMIRTEAIDGPLWAEIYYDKELRQYSRVARCTRKTKPFWTPARARATPPADY
ncbi:MAG: aminomethyltransferase family protein [Pseudomonadota bacterium]